MALVCELVGGTHSRHRLLALGVLLVLVVLVPLAHATPPDLSWLTGLWDDADFDDVIVAVVSTSGVVTTVEELSANPTRVAAETVSLPKAGCAVGTSCSAITIRAPPSTHLIAIIH